MDLPERVELYRSAVLQVHPLPRLSLLALEALSGRGNTADETAMPPPAACHMMCCGTCLAKSEMLGDLLALET